MSQLASISSDEDEEPSGDEEKGILGRLIKEINVGGCCRLEEACDGVWNISA